MAVVVVDVDKRDVCRCSPLMMSMFMVMIFLSLILAVGCPPTRTALILHMVSVISAPPSIEVLGSFLGFGLHVALKRTNDFGLGSAALLPDFFELA